MTNISHTMSYTTGRCSKYGDEDKGRRGKRGRGKKRGNHNDDISDMNTCSTEAVPKPPTHCI